MLIRLFVAGLGGGTMYFLLCSRQPTIDRTCGGSASSAGGGVVAFARSGATP